MKISRENFIPLLPALILSVIFLLVVSCTNPNAGNSAGNANAANQNAGADSSPAVKDNVVELNTLINFPEQPEEVVWREENVSGKGKKLIAVLKYPGETVPKVLAAAEKHKPAAAAEIGVEEWFPEELKAQSQLSGNETVKGNVYAANDFFNPPYANGRLVRVNGTSYFVLELTSY